MVEYGEGSLRKWRGKWQGVLPYKDESGKRKKKYKTFDDIPCDESSNRGKPAATKALSEWRAELIENDAAEAKRAKWSDLPVGEYCRRFIDTLVSTGAIELSSDKDYSAIVKSMYKTERPIGNIPIRDLTHHDVEDWETAMLKDGLSSVTVAKRHRIANRCLKHAEAVGDIDRNPMAHLSAPKVVSKPKNALDAYQRARLCSMLDEMEPTPIKSAIALALFTGLREAEVSSLRWKSVDFKGNVIYVHEAIGHKKGGTYEKNPKNTSSMRTIEMPGKLRAVLLERRECMMDECLSAGVPLSGELRVCGSIDGKYMSPDIISRQWRALAHAHSLKGVTGKIVTFHDLRHTCATVAVASHVDVRTVADIMGHKDSNMTLRVYAVADPDARKRAAKTIDEAYSETLSDVIEFRKAQ